MTLFEYVGANYTGPYISDGKFQKSVEFGEAKPQNRLDAASRLHDSLYAKYRDLPHRYLADYYYYNLVNSFDNPSLVERMAALAVMTLNRLGVDAISTLFTGQTSTAAFEALYATVKNTVVAQELIDSGKKYNQEIYDYLETDPHRQDADYQLGIRPITSTADVSPNADLDVAVYYADDFSGQGSGFQGFQHSVDMGGSRPNEESFPGIEKQNPNHVTETAYDPQLFFSALSNLANNAEHGLMSEGNDIRKKSRNIGDLLRNKIKNIKTKKKKNKIYMC